MPEKQFFGQQQHAFWIQRRQKRGVPHENIFKRLIYPFFQKKWRPGGGGSPDSTRRGTNYLHTTLLKTYTRSNFLESSGMCFGFSAPKKGGVLTRTFPKGCLTCFFRKMAPGGGGVLPDFTRRGTNYLHTTLLKNYPKSNFFGLQKQLFWIQRPQNRGDPHENILKRLIYLFFAKNGPPGGGGFYQISPDVALTTCIQLYSKHTEKAIFTTSKAYFLDSAPPK